MHKKTVLFWWIPILIIIAIFVMYSFSRTIFQIENMHTLVVYNLKNEKVTANDTTLLLYDSAEFVGKPISKVTVGDEDFVIESVSGKSLIDIKVVSDMNYCFFTADVTEYYQGVNGPKIISTYDGENNYLTLEVNLSKNKYLYPGKYNLELSGVEFIEKNLIGIYPVECATKNDTQALEDLVETYRFIVPELERSIIDRVSP